LTADPEYRDDNVPVMSVAVEDAHRFALWLGGKLPTLLQWDSAAGRYQKPFRASPFEGTWDAKDKLLNGKPDQIAVGLVKPMPVGQAAGDLSPVGCRDMSGNGREWTRILDDQRHVPIDNPQTLTAVVLRGRTFEEPFPLMFKDLADKEENGQVYDSERYIFDPIKAKDVGFRVVIEPKP